MLPITGNQPTRCSGDEMINRNSLSWKKIISFEGIDSLMIHSEDVSWCSSSNLLSIDTSSTLRILQDLIDSGVYFLAGFVGG